MSHIQGYTGPDVVGSLYHAMGAQLYEEPASPPMETPYETPVSTNNHLNCKAGAEEYELPIIATGRGSGLILSPVKTPTDNNQMIESPGTLGMGNFGTAQAYEVPSLSNGLKTKPDNQVTILWSYDFPFLKHGGRYAGIIWSINFVEKTTTTKSNPKELLLFDNISGT